jgi:hypothetical protein
MDVGDWLFFIDHRVHLICLRNIEIYVYSGKAGQLYFFGFSPSRGSRMIKIRVFRPPAGLPWDQAGIYFSLILTQASGLVSEGQKPFGHVHVR